MVLVPARPKVENKLPSFDVVNPGAADGVLLLVRHGLVLQAIQTEEAHRSAKEVSAPLRASLAWHRTIRALYAHEKLTLSLLQSSVFLLSAVALDGDTARSVLSQAEAALGYKERGESESSVLLGESVSLL